MPVPYLDLPAQFADPEFIKDLAGALASCRFVLGPEVESFEKKFADFCGTRFAAGVNSGTDALFLALLALGAGPGREVITVSNSFVATAGAIAATGATPVFVDVGPDYNMAPEKIIPAITERTLAVVPVHLTGNLADMPQICAIAKRHGLAVVEDAAQAAGAALQGRGAGAWGHAAAFSLHPLKNVNVAGDGGVVTTDSEELHQKVRRLRNHGLVGRDAVECFGYNSRLDTLQALVGARTLARAGQVAARRIENARLYDGLLADLAPDVVLPPRRPDAFQVFHTYVIQASRREDLIRFLSDRGVETKIHYPIPIHLQEPCRKMGWKPGDLPETERQSKRILSLPVHQHLNKDQIAHAARCIREFYGKD